MSLLVLAAGKGTPGVTTAALALGVTWPRPVVVVEADPAGGDIPLRLPAADGTVLDRADRLGDLASAVRSLPGVTGADARRLLKAHCQRLDGGLDVLLGPTSPTADAEAWAVLGRLFAALDDTDVLADCGRLTAGLVPAGLLRAASAVVLVTRASAEAVVHLRAALRLAAEAVPTRLGALVVDPDPGRAARELVDVLLADEAPATVVAALPFDPRGAAVLRGAPVRRPERTPLIRAAGDAARHLAAFADLPVLAMAGAR